MLTTIRSARRSRLESAVCVFTVMVCGSLSLLAASDAFALGVDHQRNASAWLSWTAVGTLGDSFVGGACDNDDRDEDDGDNDDGAGAADGVTTVLTADHGQSWHVIASALDAPSSRGSACHSLRGPPRGAIPVPDSIDRPRAGQTAGALDIDDRAKADGVGMLPAASTVLTTHHSHWTNPSGFRRSPQLGSDGISLRGPPQLPRVPRPFGSRPPPEGDAVNRCVQPCEKPQSDEVCASGARRVWSVGRSIEWFRQCEREH